ncbi:MAG: extracellular solute-binding protein [Alphaproteobacteria bacterium]|nr:extracellular solute-binding protein [Alphaproteobacteria bacterium]
MTVTRRETLRIGVIGSAAAAAAAGLPAAAQSPAKLSVFAHRVHQTVATGAQGGDITKAWSERTKTAVEWVTFDTGPLWERVQRETSLREGAIDVAFLLNTQITPRAATLFESLDPYMAKAALEDPADIFPGLMSGFRVGGQLVAVPFRHASSGMHYNEEILAERGFSGPPKTVEELVEMAKKCTYTRANGTPVVGFVVPGVTYPNVIDLARAWDGEFITPDMKCVANEPPMVKALTVLRDLFVAGAFPRNFATIQTEEVATWMQTGRAAMNYASMGRTQIYNDPAKSQFAGKVRTVPIPVSRELLGKYDVAPAKVEFWGMGIPKNARNKDAAWDLIRAMVSKDATVMTAINGNGPVRASSYADARVKQKLSYAEEEKKVLLVSRAPMPAFDQSARAADFFKEEAEAAVLGMKTPQKAMDDLVARVKPLLV